MSSDDAQRLLDEWRQVIERLEALRAEPIDETSRPFRAELEAREAELAAQVRAAGLVPETTQPRLGSWSPLPLFEVGDDDHTQDDEAHDPENAELQRLTENTRSYEGLSVAIEALFNGLKGRRARKRVRRWLKDPTRRSGLDERGARLLAVALESLNATDQARAVRGQFGLAQQPDFVPPPPLRLPQPWVPSLLDGFTAPQRAIVTALHATPMEPRRLKVVLDELSEQSEFSREALTRAADELVSPRPIPIVESVFARSGEERMLRLTRAARCMPFFPNLLVNGCGQPFRFPVYRLDKVVDAARALLRIPFASGSHLGSFLGAPELGGLTGSASPSLLTFGIGTITFSADLKVSSGSRMLTVTMLPPPLNLSGSSLDALCTAAEGVTSWTNQGERLVVSFEHPVFLQAFVRRLSGSGVLDRQLELAHLVEFDGKEAPVWVGGVLSAWLEGCRAALRERVAAPLHAARERLEVLEGLLRAADHEAVVFRMVDLSFSNAEAEWALTNLGSEAFRKHTTFSTLESGSLTAFTPTQAKAIVKAKALAARRPRLLEERDECRREFEALEASVRADAIGPALLAELDQMLTTLRAG